MQFARYLAVGAFNTAFGYGLYAGLTYLLQPRIPHGYIVASLLSSVLSVTVAFLGYKWFVFRTKGNYVREWMRCILVYGASIAFNTAMLPVVVLLLRRTTRFDAGAPYIAGAILLAGTVIYSFFGHKHFSFRQSAN